MIQFTKFYYFNILEKINFYLTKFGLPYDGKL